MEIVTPLIPSIVVCMAPRLISYRKRDKIISHMGTRRESGKIVSYMGTRRESGKIISYMGFGGGEERKISEAVQRVCVMK